MDKDTVVIDLDGTLSDCSARQHLVMGKRRDYAAFHALLEQDPVHPEVAALMFGMRMANYQIILVSARPASVREASIAWLQKHGLVNDFHALYLLRSGNDDHTPSIDLKRAWIQSYGVERILFAVDDDPRNAAMFREAGVPCLLAPGWSVQG